MKLNQLLKSDKAFTLLETILVLTVLSITLLLPILYFEGVEKRIEVDSFLKELASNITLIQNHSVINNERTMVTVKSDQIVFHVSSPKQTKVVKRLDYPDVVKYQGSPQTFTFMPGTGNIGSYSQPRFYTPYGQYKLAFQLGSGRFEIEKI